MATFRVVVNAAAIACAACVVACGVMDGGSLPGIDGGGGGWTPLPLVADTTSPGQVVPRKGNDLITGIYYAARDKGYIVSQGDNATSGDGGAVFTATQQAVTGIAFSGNGTGLTQAGGVDFTGIEPVPSGYIAMAYASDVVESTDRGATFAIHKNSAGQLGDDPVLGVRVIATGTTLVRQTGIVSVSRSAPGPNAVYTDVWAPDAMPPIPDPVPANECQSGPLGAGAPVTRDSVYISPDGQLVAYTSDPDHQAQLCVSHDGGHSFTPVNLTVTAGTEGEPPTGVYFSWPMNGIVWWGSAQATYAPYILHTTDGGATWTRVALPSTLGEDAVELHGAFFAPDNSDYGWLTGYDDTTAEPVLIATTDGGATWSVVDEGLAAAVKAAGGDKLYCGFALDQYEYWVGGARGVVLAHT